MNSVKKLFSTIVAVSKSFESIRVEKSEIVALFASPVVEIRSILLICLVVHLSNLLFCGV